MSAQQELIAAALTAAEVFELSARFEDEKNAVEALREACARAMVQPVDYMRGVLAERDALIADNERLSGLYKQAVNGRADMRSALREARAAAPQPVGEFCTDYHCPGDCGLNGHGYQHARQPVSTTEVAMPQGYAERPSDYTGSIWIESQMRTYGDAREAAGYAAGVAAGGKDAERLDFLSRQFVTVRIPMRYGSKECITGMPTDDDGDNNPWDIRAAIDAALRGEVK